MFLGYKHRDMCRRNVIILYHALGHKGLGLGTFLPKTGLELGGFKAMTLNYKAWEAASMP